ncbi:MAG TPA: polysaccharide deacetylase family protein [Dehalococcoidia bacterium]|nr:polysaccharide deacetylase family protein [Dehalococcoidia bacterium]
MFRLPPLVAVVIVAASVLVACGDAEEMVDDPTLSPSRTAVARAIAKPLLTPVPTTPEPPPPPPPTPWPTLEPLAPLPPISGDVAKVITRGDTSRMTVAFSFDAGSDTGYAGLILDTLAANGIKASFGMTGKWAERNPELLQRMVAEGHHLINHTYDHASMTGASTRTRALAREERWWELDRTEEIIMGLTGVTTKPFFRPPYGAHDASVNQDVGARGYLYNVMWTVDSRGWMGWSAGAMTQRCIQLAQPGAIYVFHVGSASQDGPALQGIIDGLRAAGYTMGTVPDVLPR